MLIVSTKNILYCSHYLRNHKGKCKMLHGHQYEVTLNLRSCYEVIEDDDCNFLMDFGKIDKIWKELFPSDHVNINEITQEENPSCEFISKWIYDQLYEKIPYLYSVDVQETPTNKCSYIGVKVC